MFFCCRRAHLSVYDFVSRYYKQQTLLDTYAHSISPLPHPDDWNVPSSISSIIIHPPNINRQAGRPKMSRARSAVEDVARRVQVCARCKGIGHNKRSCTSVNPADLNFPPEESQAQPLPSRIRRKKKCSVCHSTDHTKPKCPMRTD